MKCMVRWNRALAVGLMAFGACGCYAQRETATGIGNLTGILSITGNEPFTDISLQTVDGRMHVIQRDTSTLYSRLRSLQGKKVRLQFRLPAARNDSSWIIVDHYDLVTER